MTSQLTMDLRLNELCDFHNFRVGANTELVHALQSLPAGNEFAGFWIWGAQGLGKSHLLQAVCQAAGNEGRRALYLPLAQLPHEPEIVDGLEGQVVALDDVTAWLSDPDCEARLLQLYQNLLQAGGCLAVAAEKPARECVFGLPDLASRMRSLASFEVRALADDDLKEVVRARAALRGLELDDPVLDFWLLRQTRSLPEMLASLDRLDTAAMTEQRRITIPLVKRVLDL